MHRLMIAGTGSGSGKTTVTCGLLHCLRQQGVRVAAFKCGPDYIDPMFHSQVLGQPCHNLDLFFTDEPTTCHLLHRHGSAADVALIEGVMGYYDGMGGTTPRAGSYDLSRATRTPVVLVVGCRGLSLSVCAVIQGFMRFREDSRIVGVILNQLSPMLYPGLRREIEQSCGVRVLGYFPPMPDCRLESRHLGLVTAAEVEDLREIVERLGRQAQQTVDWKGLLELAAQAEPLPSHQEPEWEPQTPVRIGVARDKAFCFYYEDNLDLLRRMGAQLVEFSPLEDAHLPAVDGLLLGGGYPELYLERLSGNESLRREIREALQAGMPCVAECGGFMYLHEHIEGWPMVGALPGGCHNRHKLQRFGYVTLTAEQDTLLCGRGESMPAHEFHYFDSDSEGAACTARKPVGSRSWSCVTGGKRLFAGFPHLYWYGCPQVAARFIKECEVYHHEHL
ncbi:MAG: cobyrinate a,c-diamide synthase [Eubacteriales bacterium]|jgi:cobyrinic acid a,c-diamide synthase